MAALVRVLIAAACLPLLLPPGFCVCKIAGLGTTALTHLFAADHAPTEDSHDDDDDHAPGCPGAKASALPAADAPVADAVAVAPLAVVAAPACLVLSRPAEVGSGGWPAAPPLYVSHCALVL